METETQISSTTKTSTGMLLSLSIGGLALAAVAMMLFMDSGLKTTGTTTTKTNTKSKIVTAPTASEPANCRTASETALHQCSPSGKQNYYFSFGVSGMGYGYSYVQSTVPFTGSGDISSACNDLGDSEGECSGYGYVSDNSGSCSAWSKLNFCY